MSEAAWDLTRTRRTIEERHYEQREQHGQRCGAVEHPAFVGIGKELRTTRFLITSIAQSLKAKINLFFSPSLIFC